MSVIFKEQRSSQLLSILKVLSVFLMLLFVFLTALIYYSGLKIDQLEENLKIAKGEGLKYNELLQSSKKEVKSTKFTAKNYNLIRKLAAAADQIYFNSIQLKGEKILLLEAVTKKQAQIFNFTDNLILESEISTASIVRINKSSDYNFQLKCQLNFR